MIQYIESQIFLITRWGWQAKEDPSGILPSLTFEMTLQEDEVFQGTRVGYGFLQRRHHLAETALSSLHGCSAWLALFTLFHARMSLSTKPWLALPCLFPALALLYVAHTPWWSVKYSTIYHLSTVLTVGKNPHAFLKKLWNGIKTPVELSPLG